MSQNSDLERGTDDKSIPDQQQPERHIYTAHSAARAPVLYPTVQRYSQYHRQPPVPLQGPQQQLQQVQQVQQQQFNNNRLLVHQQHQQHQQPPNPARRKMMFEGSTLFYPPGYAQSPDPQGPGMLTPGYLPTSYFPDEPSVLSSVPSDYMDDNTSVSSVSPAYWGYINHSSGAGPSTVVPSMHSPGYTSLPQTVSPSTTNYSISLYNNGVPESPINPKQQLLPLHQPYMIQPESDHRPLPPQHLHEQTPHHHPHPHPHQSQQQAQMYDSSSISSMNSSSVHTSSLSTRSTTSSSNTSSSIMAMPSTINTMTMPNYLYVGQQYAPRDTTVDSAHIAAPQTASTSSSPRSNESNSPGGPVYYSSSVYDGNSGLSASNDESSSSTSRSDKKKYQCEICGKYFKRDLPRHLRTHQEVARFVCPYPRENCPHKRGQFNRPYDFKKHLLHGHFIFDDQKNVRSFRDLKSKLHHPGTCVCGLRFEASQWLDQHVLGGSNLCPYLVRPSMGHDSKDIN